MKLNGETKIKILLIGLATLIFSGSTGIVSACDSNWNLIFRHDVSNSAVFANDEEAKKINENIADPTSVDKYSRLYQLENYRNPNDGKFEFKLVYPNKNITNQWKQSSNPVTRSTRGVDGYEAISIDTTAGGRGGLEHELGSTTFLDGVPNTATWRWAIGSHRTYTNNHSIPGPGQIISLVELYVCGDDTAPDVSFTTNTPSNNTYTNQDNFTTESLVTEKNIKSVDFQYDGINHNIYNKNIKLQLGFDNISSIGEIENSKVVGTNNNSIIGQVHGAERKELNQGNGAYEFNDRGDYIKIDDNNFLNVNGDYSISLWDYYDTSLMTGSYHTLFQRNQQNKTNGFLWSWFYASPSNTRLYFQYANGTAIKTISFPNIKTPNNWQHIVYSYIHATNELKLYVNGELKGTQVLTDYLLPQTDDLYIGSYHGASNHTFIGKIDEFKIFNNALDNSEVSSLYHQELNKNYKSYYENINTDTYKFTIIQALTEGLHNYKISALDLMNHTGSTESRNITMDVSNPEGSITYSNTDTTNQDVIATLNLSESGIVVNNNGSNQYTFTENGTFIFEFEDSAGNSNTATATVNNIDKVIPTANVIYSFSLPTSGTVTATLTGLSENVTIINNNGSNQYTFTGNGAFTFEFVDNAGNTGETTATVNNIYPEYQTELSYNNPLLIFPSDIHNYIRTFSDSTNPDRQCIYKTLKIDLGYTGTYAIIPAWTCYTMNGGTSNDLNIYNTIVQKTSNERYKFLFGKASIKTYFDKPIKFVFNKNMFSGVVVGSLNLEPNLFIKHIGGSEYISDSISHSYYANCNNGLSDISNSQLIYYNDSYIGYTCEGGDFKVGFNINGGSNNGGNNNGSNNSGSNNNTGGNIIYNTYNTYNTYNSSSSTKKYYNGTDGYNNSNTNSDSYNNYDDIDNSIEVTDDLIKKDTNTIIKEVNTVALKKGIAINKNLLNIYIYGRKNYIITNPYYSEDYLLENIDKKTVAIMLSRYAKQIAKLPEINSEAKCKFNDIGELDRSTQNYIVNSCKYGLFVPDGDKKFNPNSKVKRTEFADSLLKLIGEDIHGSADNNISVLKDKGILTIIDGSYVTKETILVVIKRLSKMKGESNLINSSNTYKFNKPYKLGYKGIGVRKLQEFLINYGTLGGKTTGYFGKKTLEALYQFQLKEGILTEDAPRYLRGYMGPGTRDVINKLIK